MVRVPDPRLVRFPLRTAVVAVTPVADTVTTVGGIPGHAAVVNESTAPLPEPPELVAVALKLYGVPQVRPVAVAVKVPVDDFVPAGTETPPAVKPTVVSVPEPSEVRFPLSTAEVVVTDADETVTTVGGTSGQAVVVKESVAP